MPILHYSAKSNPSRSKVRGRDVVWYYALLLFFAADVDDEDEEVDEKYNSGQDKVSLVYS